MDLTKKTVRLFDENPCVRCYRIHAYMLNIMGISYPKFYDYVISNYLCLHNGKDLIRKEYLDFHLDNNYLNIRDVFRNNDWFDIVQVHDFNVENYIGSYEIKNIIITFLHEGYYVLHNVNEAYLPHSSQYGESIETANNIALTYGYDREKDVFMMLDYDCNGRFGSSIVGTNDYLNSIANVTVTNRLNFIRAKKGLEFNFDISRALKLLGCHIYSKNAYPDHEDYKNNIFGYEGVERTLREISSNGLNIIRIRAIKEHKDIVLKHIKYVLDNHYIDRKEYYDDYKEIYNDMNIIFMRFIKKMISGRRNFNEEIDDIRRLNEKEANLIEKYLHEVG